MEKSIRHDLKREGAVRKGKISREEKQYQEEPLSLNECSSPKLEKEEESSTLNEENEKPKKRCSKPVLYPVLDDEIKLLDNVNVHDISAANGNNAVKGLNAKCAEIQFNVDSNNEALVNNRKSIESNNNLTKSFTISTENLPSAEDGAIVSKQCVGVEDANKVDSVSQGLITDNPASPQVTSYEANSANYTVTPSAGTTATEDATASTEGRTSDIDFNKEKLDLNTDKRGEHTDVGGVSQAEGRAVSKLDGGVGVIEGRELGNEAGRERCIAINGGDMSRETGASDDAEKALYYFDANSDGVTGNSIFYDNTKSSVVGNNFTSRRRAAFKANPKKRNLSKPTLKISKQRSRSLEDAPTPNVTTTNVSFENMDVRASFGRHPNSSIKKSKSQSDFLDFISEKASNDYSNSKDCLTHTKKAPSTLDLFSFAIGAAALTLPSEYFSSMSKTEESFTGKESNTLYPNLESIDLQLRREESLKKVSEATPLGKPPLSNTNKPSLLSLVAGLAKGADIMKNAIENATDEFAVTHEEVRQY